MSNPTVESATSAAAPLIQLQDVSKIYYTDDLETHALSGVHLEVRRGEFIAITGPSGCGKSTLLGILGLLDSPSSGTYLLQGQPAQQLDASERAAMRSRAVGFIFQSFNLIGDLTVLENVELPLRLRHGLAPEQRRRRSHEALERVGMMHRLKHYPSQLSGGQQQRVAVARALVGAPDIILADEPTGNLDSVNGESVMNLLGELHAAGSTLCIVTHDNRYADYAQRRVGLFDGRVVEDSSRGERA